MAAVLNSIAPSAGSDIEHQNLHSWVEAFNDVIWQFDNGITAPIVSLGKLEQYGFRGVINWANEIGKKINARVETAVDLLGGKITVYPLGQMPANAATAPGAEVAGGEENAVPKEKIARPPNSFIIYRQEWHPEIVKAHPGMHNNDISKLIARKWKAESEGVKNEYKRKAEDAKRQHAIDHPGYQYQPRKPSEKKKRMTKNKLAKLKAQNEAAAAQDSMKIFEEMLANITNDKQVEIGTFQPPHHQGFRNLQPSQDSSNHLAFDASADNEMSIYNQVTGWNTDNPMPPRGLFSEPAVHVGQPLADHQPAASVPQPDVLYNFEVWNNSFGNAPPPRASRNPAARFYNTAGELERQDYLSDASMNELINFNACADPVVEGSDADDALENFHENYLLDFDASGSLDI